MKTNAGQASSTLIPEYIGSAFDKVITVADNIDHIKDIAAGIAGLAVKGFIGDTPPTQPKAGATWYCTLDGRNYIWYEDVDSGQWVESSPQSNAEAAQSVADDPYLAGNIFTLWKRSAAEAGYNLVTGSFEEGGVLTSSTDVLWHKGLDNIYSWTGAYPINGYVVPPNTNPIGNANYVPRTDVVLRDQLASDDGFTRLAYKIEAAIAVKFTLAELSKSLPVYPEQFGAVGDGMADDRPSMQAFFDYLAETGRNGSLTPGKKYLINSYSGRGFASALSWEGKFILDMTGAEIVFGSFFDDKEFIGISFKGRDPSPTPTFDGGGIIGGKLSFSGVTSRPRTSFILNRVGVHTGQVGGLVIHRVTFDDGDIVNAIKVNDDVFAKKSNVIISNCIFSNLIADNPINTDHSAVYLKANNSHVIDCIFSYTSKQAKRVACAVELHGDNVSWQGGSLVGTQKGVFLTALAQEGSSSGQLVTGVTADITNAFAYIWSEAGVSLSDVLITGNNIKCRHIPGEPSPYNNYQGLLATSGFDNTAVTGKNIECRGNTVKVVHTEITGRDTAMFMQLGHSGIKLIENTFHNTPTGIKAAFNLSTMKALNWVISGNKFLSNGVVTDIFCDIQGKAEGVVFSDNKIKATSWTGLSRVFRVTGTATDCCVSVSALDLLGAVPSFAIDMPVTNNKIENVLFGASVSYPVVAGSSHELATVTHSALSSMYVSVSNYDIEVKRCSPPTGIDCNRAFVGSGAAPAMLVYNHQVAESTASTASCAAFVTTF